MSVKVTEVPKEVVTKWTRQVTITCDGCGVEWDQPQHAYANPSGWVIVKPLESPHWNDQETEARDVKHFHALACLKKWAARVEYIWEAAGANE